MKDIKIRALGKKVIPDNFLIIIHTTKAAKVINDFFESEKKKGDEYLVNYSYYSELSRLAGIANLKVDFEDRDID